MLCSGIVILPGINDGLLRIHMRYNEINMIFDSVLDSASQISR